jgi:hypothetical protein
MKTLREEYGDMEHNEYIPDDFPRRKRKDGLKQLYRELSEEAGMFGEVYLGDGMVLNSDGTISEQL